jgi:hypothetical protein
MRFIDNAYCRVCRLPPIRDEVYDGSKPRPHGTGDSVVLLRTSNSWALLRWEQGLFGGKLLSPASLEKITTPFKNDYAFGLVAHA